MAGLPAWWDRLDYPNFRLFRDASVKASGEASLKLTGFPVPGKNRVRAIKDEVPLRPHTDYVLRFKLKTENLRAEWNNVGVKVIARKQYLVDSIELMGARFAPTQDWTGYEFTFNSGEHDRTAVLVGVWHGISGTAWFDDVELVEAGR